jgi:hypothetical protein
MSVVLNPHAISPLFANATKNPFREKYVGVYAASE